MNASTNHRAYLSARAVLGSLIYLLLASAAPPALAGIGNVALYANPAHVDESAGGELENTNTALVNLGYTVTQFTGFASTDWNNAFAADVVVIPELEDGTIPVNVAAIAAINQNLDAGKALVVMGAQAAREETLLNAVRGWSLVNGSFSGAGLFPKSAGVSGFTNSPASITALSAVFQVSTASLPAGAMPVYEDGTETMVFVAGAVAYVGYDFFSGTNAEWESVLGDAITAARSAAFPLPAHNNTFSGNSRGYWFTAPTSFVITGLEVPGEAGPGNQSITVVRFNSGVPPIISSPTNDFTTLFLTQNDLTAGCIPVNISVSAGDIIGVMGVRGSTNSYAPSGNQATTILGVPVTLTRMGMQLDLSTTAPQDLWQESGGQISRTQLYVAPSSDIEVEQPAGNPLADNASTVDYGQAVLGSRHNLDFTVNNPGLTDLTGLGITIDGTNNDDFTVTVPPAMPIAPGGSTTFRVEFEPGALGSRSANLHIASNDPDEGVFDIALTGSGLAPPTGNAFKIASLDATRSAVVDHNAETGDDRGGIAVSSSKVFVTGDIATAAFNITDLGSGTPAGSILDGLCSDLNTGISYTLALDGVPHVRGTTSINQLIRLNSTTGAPTATIIPLTSTITVSSFPSFGPCGVFSGQGRVVVYNGTDVYDIQVPSGIVANLGAMGSPIWLSAENWARWGVAEYFDGELHLAYHNGSDIMKRIRVSDEVTETISSFTNLGQIASWTVSPNHGRWYFHNEFSFQFGGFNENLGYADASFSEGSLAFFDDFDPGLNTSLWADSGGGAIANTIGQAGGLGSDNNSLYFNGGGSRFVTTIPLDTSGGGTVSFLVARANGSAPWENADNGEEIVLEYSTDGTNFTVMGGPYSDKEWQFYQEVIPVAAQTPSTQFRFRQLSNSGAGFDNWALDNVQIDLDTPLVPEIAVEQPAGNNLVDGADTVDFGTITVGAPRSRVFRIRNFGTAGLTGFGFTIDGANSGDFSVSVNPDPVVTPGGLTEFTVDFTPSALGTRTAALHITSSDADESPFDIDLTGEGIPSVGTASIFYNGTYIDLSREAPRTQESLENLGYVVTQFTSIVDTAWNAAFASDVVVVPELELSSLVLSAAAIDAINANLAAGKGLVVMGQSGSNDTAFLNALRGWSLVGGATISGATAPKAGGLVGFSNSPASLFMENGSYSVSTASLPAEAVPVYEFNSDTGVFVAGPVAYLGFDWFDGPTPDWNTVLGDAIAGVQSSAIPLPPFTGPFNPLLERGYFFQAPTSFVITGLMVPTDIGTANQDIAVVRFDPGVEGPPSFFSGTTNDFTTLFLTQNDPTVGVIPVSIPVVAGEWIGVLGGRGGVASYGNNPFVSNILGFPTTLARMGMQFPLATNAPQNLWTEAGNPLGRVELYVSAEVVEAPEIEVSQDGTPLVDGGSTVDYGPVPTGLGFGKPLEVVISNPGSGDLFFSGISLVGANFGDFDFGVAPLGIIPSGGSTVVTMTFTPSATGVRTATLTLISDDADEPTFEIALTGEGVTPSPYETWLAGFYTGADFFDPGISGINADSEGDNIQTALEYVLDLIPTQMNAIPWHAVIEDNAGNQYLALQVDVPQAFPSDATLVIEESPTVEVGAVWTPLATKPGLFAWSLSNGGSLSQGAPSGGYIPVTVRSPNAIGPGNSRGYMRLRAVIP